MRSVGLVLCAALAVWGLLLLDVRGERRSEAASRPASAARPSEGAEAAIGGARPVASAAPTWPERLLGKLTSRSRPPPARAEATAAGAAVTPAGSTLSGRDAPPRPSGELGEGELSPEFKELEQQYADDARDEARAEHTEHELRQLFKDHPLANKLAVLNCQTEICRLVLEDIGSEDVSELLYLPGLRRLTGLGPDSPYSLRAGQFSLYFRAPPPPSAPDVARP